MIKKIVREFYKSDVTGIYFCFWARDERDVKCGSYYEPYLERTSKVYWKWVDWICHDFPTFEAEKKLRKVSQLEVLVVLGNEGPGFTKDLDL